MVTMKNFSNGIITSFMINVFQTNFYSNYFNNYIFKAAELFYQDFFWACTSLEFTTAIEARY